MDYYSLDDRKKLDDQLAIENQALDDIISNQNKAENEVIDDYNSVGSTLGRMFGAYASVRGGANPSQVLQNYSNQLDTRLNNARNKYKDERDTAYNRYKDTLARREALNKGLIEQDKENYNRERDTIKDSKDDRDYKLRERDMNLKETLGKFQMGQQDAKNFQAQQDLKNQEVLEDATYNNLEYLGNFALDPKRYNMLKNNRRSLLGEIALFNTKYAEANGIKPENQSKWIETNPSLPGINDSFETANAKMKALLLQAPGGKRAYARQQEAKKQETIDKTNEILDKAKPLDKVKLPALGDQEVTVTQKGTLFVPPDKDNPDPEHPNGTEFVWIADENRFVDVTGMDY